MESRIIRSERGARNSGHPALKGEDMQILKNIKVPTGNILVVEGDKGKLELLSLGDYGKDINVKCDCMGLTREIDNVQHGELLPLEKKWVITISTQYGCSMGCNFCDVPKVGKGINATFEDLIGQVMTGISLHPEIKKTERLNIHFARMGEPTWNKNVLVATEWLNNCINHQYKIHPVVSTIMPKNNKNLSSFISQWMDIKNDMLNGEAGLQISVNSTNENEREIMFNGNAHTLKSISTIMQGYAPLGRKITLNFALAEYEIDPSVLKIYFDPEYYLIKLTPMHKTIEALHNGIKTGGNYTEYLPYKETEEKLKNAGYDVLVFIASEYEDLGRITCGNAILSGSMPECPYEIIV
jgi:23S rRNA (adenine2503-C2)-methyltransferase